MRFPWQREKALQAVVQTALVEAPEVRAATDMSIDTLIQRLEMAYRTTAGISVTPETCMQAPTVQAIVTSVSRRISVSPIQVLRRSHDANGHERKERLPSHPVAKLLNRPNDWQARQQFFLDAASSLVRHGTFYAFKAQGNTGPIRRLIPLHSGSVTVELQDDMTLLFRATMAGGVQRDLRSWEVLYARGGARDYVNGDSPVWDVREAIATEIAMERFGAGFFGNGAMPLMVFKLMQGFADFKDRASKDAFLDSVRGAVGGGKQYSSFMLPKGMEVDKYEIDNEKTQMVDARKYQRTVIAGAFGVPPHLVGDLERATFNNVEQQDTDFVINVVLPIAQQLESAMERDLLTIEDRNSGVVIRFNLDAVQRADFKSRQEGLQIQRQNGVISPNEWREAESRNPISDADGGESYIYPANMTVAGQEPATNEPTGSTSNDQSGAAVRSLRAARSPTR